MHGQGQHQLQKVISLSDLEGLCCVLVTDAVLQEKTEAESSGSPDFSYTPITDVFISWEVIEQ